MITQCLVSRPELFHYVFSVFGETVFKVTIQINPDVRGFMIYHVQDEVENVTLS